MFYVHEIHELDASRAEDFETLVREQWVPALASDPETRLPRPDVVGAVVAAAAQQGVLVLTAGTAGNVIRFLPSLAITDEQLLDAVGVIGDALTTL